MANGDSSNSKDHHTPSYQTLTKRMKASTKEVHDESDRKVNLQLGLVLTSRRLYGESISLFAAIYDHLESVLTRHKSHPQLCHFHDLLYILNRSNGFWADVAYYLTPTQQKELQNWRVQKESADVNEDDDKSKTTVTNPPELAEYLNHLDALEKEDPIRLLAYVYHVYMAIFAGGYIIKKIVKKAMRLSKDSNDGVRAFSINDEHDKINDIQHKEDVNYNSRKLKSAKQIRTEIKRIMDDVIAPTLSEKEIESILEESIYVFRRNNAVVGSIEGTASFESAFVRCRNFVILPAVVVLLAVIYASFGPYFWMRT